MHSKHWAYTESSSWVHCKNWAYIDGILPEGPYPPCLCMADRALLAGYPRHVILIIVVHLWGIYPSSQLVTNHYNDVIMSTMASQITSLTIVYSTVYSAADQRKHQSSAALAFVGGIHWGPVNSPHKGPVTRKMSPFGVVIMSALV